MLVLTMFGSVLCGPVYDKRLILLATLTVQAALAVAVGLLVGSGHIALCTSSPRAWVSASRRRLRCRRSSALVPGLSRKAKSPRDRRRSLDLHATRLAGPALGRLALGALGTARLFMRMRELSDADARARDHRPRPPAMRGARKNGQTGMKEGLLRARRQADACVIALLAVSTFSSRRSS